MKKICILAVLLLTCFMTFAYAQTEEAWKNEVSLSYSQATGNTKNSKLVSAYEGNRKTDADELNLKATTLYSSQNKKMDGQKHTGSARYAPNFGDSQWYYFGKIEGEHDRFANIDYRIIPSLGLGYWFSDTDDWKAQAEVGLGHEFVEYTDGSNDDNVSVIPRAYFEKAVFENAKLSEELIFYPNLKEGDQYRFRSETRFTNPLSDVMSLRVSFIDEFNSSPLGEAKKNDTQLLLSLVYSF